MKSEQKTEHVSSPSITRAPIVVVMGHVDHGKSKILETIRHTKMLEKEAGGITQHIGAYEVTHKKRHITFIDTPGHEAFSKIRSRGARVADIAILVIAADEGIKPQTKEAIEIIRAQNLPFIVALNKIDKPEANPERVKSQLAEETILVESFGGKVPSVEISAKEGTNLDDLLEMILLVADLENLTAHPEQHAEGVVIEAHRDPRRGITATLLILDGTLRKQDVLILGAQIDTIKIFENFASKPVIEAGPSAPVLITGLNNMPGVGDPFHSFLTKNEAEEYIAHMPNPVEEAPHAPVQDSGEEKLIFSIVLKTDGGGSQEALEEAIKKITSGVLDLRIIKSEVGDINESDVKMAQATSRVTIVGFKVDINAAVRKLAEDANIRIVTGEIIYELVDQVKRAIEERIPPEIKRVNVGKAKILKVFKREGNKQIVGGRVEEGSVRKGMSAEIKRNKEEVGKGLIVELQRNKIPADEVGQGSEFGMLIETKTEIRDGDILEIVQEETIKRNL